MTIRPATTADLPRVAELHAARIAEGFLTSLGVPFLRRLYRRVARSDGSFILVDAVDDDIAGFVAGVADLSALYRSFLIRDGVVAGAIAAPKIARAVPRVIETLKYPNATGDLPDAEILAVAVAAEHLGRGIGTALVRAATAEFLRREITAAKVVTTADNTAALAMYRSAGYQRSVGLKVHAGRSSEVLVWTAS